MANQVTTALAMLTVLLLSSDWTKMAVGQDYPGQMKWCIAKPSTADSELINIIEYVCSHEYANCTVFKQGGPCFLPDTYTNHASVAMNHYYQANGRFPHDCYFGGAGLITITDPSYGSCIV